MKVKNLNITRLECKDFIACIFFRVPYHLNITRLECKDTQNNGVSVSDSHLNITRLECKVQAVIRRWQCNII